MILASVLFLIICLPARLVLEVNTLEAIETEQVTNDVQKGQSSNDLFGA